MCSISFGNRGTLKSHQFIHTENCPFTCVCNKTFEIKKHLTNHILLYCAKQGVDTKERQFTCPVCNKLFSSKNHYQNIVGNLLNLCDVCSVAKSTSNVQKCSTQL